MRNKKIQLAFHIRIRCLTAAFGLIFSLSTLNGNAQADTERGLPFVTNYFAKVYQAAAQNWAIIQDDRGVMYFGNNTGLLEYDGVKWRTLTQSANSIVRSLGKDQNGRVYFGGYSNFGY